MSPGEYAHLALSSVLSGSVRDRTAVIVIVLSSNGDLAITSNVANRSDVTEILHLAVSADANPSYESITSPPAKA
jgi:predicted AAA+ superfamily ATPase